jgi:glyceraldehyde 3-phosphate dehydrogenase
MAIRVGINGFGRIGRLTFRVLVSRPDEFEVSLINDVAESDTLVNLLKYDTTYGPFPGEVSTRGSRLSVNGRAVLILRERDPARLPWTDAGVDVVF